MKKGLLLISLLLLTLCANLHAQETDSWVFVNSNGEIVNRVEIPIDELEEDISAPAEPAEDDEYYDENMRFTTWRPFNDGQNIAGKGVGTEKAVVVLEMPNKQGDYKEMCSGVIVAPFTVLTAAHCLIDFITSDVSMQVVAVGVKKTKQGYPYSEVVGYWLPEEYENYHNNQKAHKPKSDLFDSKTGGRYDYGFILLKDPIHTQTGLFGVKSTRDYDVGAPIYILGRLGTERERTLWKLPGKITWQDKSFFFSDAYQARGLSGGPVILQNNVSQVSGIFVAGENAPPFEGIILRITPKIVRMVLKYREVLKPLTDSQKKKVHST
ncbi:MAG: trypsin-like serine protease [Elusimicrobiaceae bacterium]|nr:trypsin-like serine protease [Elusimicrobiaceae bacterium]